MRPTTWRVTIRLSVSIFIHLGNTAHYYYDEGAGHLLLLLLMMIDGRSTPYHDSLFVGKQAHVIRRQHSFPAALEER